VSRWNLATWRGPTTHRDAGALRDVRGLVVHIAEGTYEGTIAWQKNVHADRPTSSHFVVARTGSCAQIVDTGDASWAQKAGNKTWLSVECEGFTKASPHYRQGWEKLTGPQCQTIARLLVEANRRHAVPLRVTHDPGARGLGFHSMGGAAWGHQSCPGASIIQQLGGIVLVAQALAAPKPTEGALTMIGVRYAQAKGTAAVYAGDGITCRWVPNEPALALMRAEQVASGVPAARLVTKILPDEASVFAYLGVLDGPAGNR